MGQFTDLMRQRPVLLHQPIRGDSEMVTGRGIGEVEELDKSTVYQYRDRGRNPAGPIGWSVAKRMNSAAAQPAVEQR